MRLLDRRPRPVVPLDVDLVRVFPAHIPPAKLPIHGVLRIIPIAAVDDAVEGLQTFVLVEGAGFAGELEVEGVLIRRARMVRFIGFPAHGVLGRVHLVAEVLVVLVHARGVGVALAPVFLPAFELVVDFA